jgi:hypothetical protein
MTIELKVTDGPNPGAYLLGSDVLDLVGMKIFLHPKHADFDPDAKGRVMISALYGTPYHTAAKTTKADGVAQIADREITITAHAIPASAYAGQTLHFRVLTPDPDDPSPYEPNTVGGDNRDSVIGAGNLSAASDAIVPTIINGVEVGAAEVVLKITDRYAGDNYIVQCSLNAGFTPISDETDLLTAWKRVYAEVDRMFKYGEDCIDGANFGAPAGVGASGTTAYVPQVDRAGIPGYPIPLNVGDSVVVISSADDVHMAGETVRVTAITPITLPSGETCDKITLDPPLANTYATVDRAHLGRVTLLSDGTVNWSGSLFSINVGDVAKVLAHGFIEILYPSSGSGYVPYKEDYIATGNWPRDKDDMLIQFRKFSQPWFKNRQYRVDDEATYTNNGVRSAQFTGKPNYFHFVRVKWVCKNAAGIGLPPFNVCYVGTSDAWTIAHECGHQFDSWHERKTTSTPPIVLNKAHNHHYDATDCVMRQNSFSTKPCPEHALLGWPSDSWPSWRDIPDGR